MPRIPTAEIEIDGRRKIINADDPRVQECAARQAPSVPESPEDVAGLKKAEVVAFLDAHGSDFDKAAKVDDLRALLIETMFVSE